MPVSQQTFDSTENYLELSYPNIFSRENAAVSLARAKRNVIEHYSVIGIMEDLEGFFYTLEKMFPGFFKGARDVYLEGGGYLPCLQLLYNGPLEIILQSMYSGQTLDTLLDPKILCWCNTV